MTVRDCVNKNNNYFSFSDAASHTTRCTPPDSWAGNGTAIFFTTKKSLLKKSTGRMARSWDSDQHNAYKCAKPLLRNGSLFSWLGRSHIMFRWTVVES
jgi:hypothetical protein